MERIQARYQGKLSPPVLLVTGTRAATIRGIKFSCRGPRVEGLALSIPVVKLDNATAHLTECAVVGSVGDGILIGDGCNIEIDNSLIAAAWSTGIVIGPGTGQRSRVYIHDCDIRNCYYAGVRIGKGSNDTRIDRCRISGAAWHGVRYDDTSPYIADNLIFGNARAGVYASGRTKAILVNNLFYANEMCGMACWFQNQDRIWTNTFAENKEVGLAVAGACEPEVRKDIFCAHPIGISVGSVNDDSPFAQSPGPIKPHGSVFWANEGDMQWRPDPNTVEIIALDESDDVQHVDPNFISPEDRNFSLHPDSMVRRQEIGAPDPISFDSPWPLQPEERGIIPEGDTRHYRKWRHAN